MLIIVINCGIVKENQKSFDENFECKKIDSKILKVDNKLRSQTCVHSTIFS